MDYLIDTLRFTYVVTKPIIPFVVGFYLFLFLITVYPKLKARFSRKPIYSIRKK